MELPEIERVRIHKKFTKVSPSLASAQSEAVGLELDTEVLGASLQVAFLPEAPTAPCPASDPPDQNPLAAWQAARAQVHTRTSAKRSDSKF